jgi:PAS domain S-box-containing protein
LSVIAHDPEIATLLFEHARDIVLVIDAESGALVDVNEAAELAYGYERAELLALTIFELRVSDPDPVLTQMQRANDAGILFRTVHQRKDGSTFPVEVSSRGQTIGGRRMLLSVIRDITERCRLENEREALIETTRRALEVREEFLVIASHELRSPVTNANLQLFHLARLVERAGGDPAIENATRAALGEVRRLSTLITTLLDAQQAAKQVVLARGPVDLADLITEVAGRLRGRAELVGSSLKIDVPAVRGQWDRLRLEQVFTNLLVNALKYGRGGAIEVLAAVEGSQVRVDVRDNGIGIAPVDAARVFEKFERAVPTSDGGLGLGLFITRQLVDAHGGTLSFDSVPGQGTTFHVCLPLQPN